MIEARMADYYPLVAKAVSALCPQTEEARRRVYDRARVGLLSELQKLVPALDQSEIMAEQLYLEVAIGEVEADTQREQSAQMTAATPFTVFHYAVVAAAPSPPANQNSEGARKGRTNAREQDFGRSGGGAAARYQEPCAQRAGENDCERPRDTWLTQLLARASRGTDNDQQDFTPKRTLRYAGSRV
jgi:hypothetical protein